MPATASQKLTRDQFEQFLSRNVSGHYGGAPMVFAPPPWDIQPCDCGDVNCLGWRVRSETEPDAEDLLSELLKVLEAAAHALHSYEYGNAAPELAREVAAAADAVLAKVDREKRI